LAILLVRHGETAGNATRRIQFPDTPLHERGLAQAERLASRLAKHSVGAILTSDYDRARMTAEAVQRSTGASLALEPLLRERHFGELRGMAYADLETDPFAPGYEPPGGESWEAFHARVDRAWVAMRRVAEATPGDLVVVSHGLLCYSLVGRKLSLGEGQEPPLGFGNTAVTEIDPAPPHATSLVNCTAHLDDATAHDSTTRSGL
jgi:probable phosphoglycerate mutase